MGAKNAKTRSGGGDHVRKDSLATAPPLARLRLRSGLGFGTGFGAKIVNFHGFSGGVIDFHGFGTGLGYGVRNIGIRCRIIFSGGRKGGG